MKKTFTTSAPRALHRLLLAAFFLAGSSTAWSSTTLEVWHSLPDHNKAVFENLVKQYNRQQSDVSVQLRAFATEDELDSALNSSEADQLPQLFQFGETSGLDDIASRSYVQPLYNVLAKSPALKNTSWFIPAANNFMHDSRGRTLALPFMAEIPVMYYNVDAFKRAGIDPTVPAREWPELQGQLVTLANNGSRYCPLTSDQPVSINLENLAAVNNQFYAQPGKAGFNFDILYIRHLSTMISWVRSEIMVRPEFGPQSADRFEKGECAVMLSNSGNIGRFKQAKGLNFALTGLPYYPQVTNKPGSPFVAGSGLWLSKQNAEQEKASIDFVSYLASAPVAEKWYQNTGYLPLTGAAYSATADAYYGHMGDWKDIVAVYGREPSSTMRGFKVNNYHQIRAMFNQTLDNALQGNQPATTALRTAAEEANKLAVGRR